MKIQVKTIPNTQKESVEEKDGVLVVRATSFANDVAGEGSAGKGESQ